MTSPPSVVYEIDSRDRLRFVNGAWAEFARANDADKLASPALGRSLWDSVVDGNITDLYRAMFGRVRATGETISFDYRCDSPDDKRFMTMIIEPAENRGIRLINKIWRIEPQSPGRFFQRFKQEPLSIPMCSFCADISLHECWLPASDAIPASLVFAEDLPLKVWPSVCPKCRARRGIDG